MDRSRHALAEYKKHFGKEYREKNEKFREKAAHNGHDPALASLISDNFWCTDVEIALLMCDAQALGVREDSAPQVFSKFRNARELIQSAKEEVFKKVLDEYEEVADD